MSGARSPHRVDRRGDAAGRGDVVVLDQRRVAERHPVVDAAAAAHGVLLERPQARGGLAGVADRGAGAGDGVDPVPGQRRDAGQVADQVERGPLGGEQRAGRAGDAEHGLARAARRCRRPRAGRPRPPPPAHQVEDRRGDRRPRPARRATAARRRRWPGARRARWTSVVTSGPKARSSSSARADDALDLGGVEPGRRQRGGVVRRTAPQVERRSCHDQRSARAAVRGLHAAGVVEPVHQPDLPTRARVPGRRSGGGSRGSRSRAAAAAASRVATVCRAVASTAARSSGPSTRGGTAASVGGQAGEAGAVAEDAGVAGGRPR